MQPGACYTWRRLASRAIRTDVYADGMLCASVVAFVRTLQAALPLEAGVWRLCVATHASRGLTDAGRGSRTPRAHGAQRAERGGRGARALLCETRVSPVCVGRETRLSLSCVPCIEISRFAFLNLLASHGIYRRRQETRSSRHSIRTQLYMPARPFTTSPTHTHISHLLSFNRRRFPSPDRA